LRSSVAHRPYRDGDNLMIGDTVLNGRNDIVDQVLNAAGGVATIFSGDTRIATTIRGSNGARATATTLVPGPAHTAALHRGATYRGAATILGAGYITAYHPLKDASGATSTERGHDPPQR